MLGAITHDFPVTFRRGLFCLVKKSFYLPLDPLACHYGGIVISGRWFVHDYDSVTTARLKRATALPKSDLG